MGQVYLASAQGAAGFEKVVALKLLSKRHTGDETLVRSLLREAMIGVRLDNERLVQVLDFGEEEGRYFIAMEYVRGFNLSHVIDYVASHKATLPLQVAVHIARTVADALAYIHKFADVKHRELGLIHGDVSPSNVLLGADGRIKLSDYGVSVLAGETDGTRIIAGKPPYLPAEAFLGEKRAQQWDVYALGLVLYEMLYGKPAFRGNNIEALKLALVAGPPPIGRVRSDCPAELLAVVDRAVAYEASERYPTAAALREALDEALPRAVDDLDAHREFIAQVYADDGFVASHGELPTIGGRFRAALNLAPILTSRELETARSIPRTPQGLKFGLSPALGPERARAVGEQLARFLSGRLGRTVSTTAFADYRSLVDATATSEIDLAWMPPVAYAHAAERAVGALAIVERAGRPSFESAIFVRDDSPFHTLDDLRGKRLAWVDRESASGYLLAAVEIVRHLGRLDEVLASQHFFGSHREVCEAVLNGWADAGATFVALTPSGRMANASWTELLPDRAAELRAIAFTPPIPCDNIAHSPGLPERVRADVRSLFLSMHTDPDGQRLLEDVFHADGFTMPDDAAYERVRARLLLL